MKRFKFSLETLDKVKKTQEKQQKAILAAINHEIAMLNQSKDACEQHFDRLNQEYTTMGEHGTNVVELQVYASFFIYLQEQIDQFKEQIRLKEEERIRCQRLLIRLMQEIKALEKLRGRQYEQYMIDVKAEEEKEIGDFVSFHTQFG